MENVQYWLGWFDKAEGDFVGEKRLDGVDEPEFVNAFHLQPGDMKIDSFPVREEHLSWLASRGIHAQLQKYDYFVAAIVPLDSRDVQDLNSYSYP